TETGRHIALEVIRHHRLIELYLTEALGFTWDEVHEQADILEHVISEKLEERIAAALDYPTVDPHGDPIPARDGTLPQRSLVSLATLAPGEGGVVARITDDHNAELLRYLSELALELAAVVTVRVIAPVEGPLPMEVGAHGRIIGRAAAERVFVERI